MINVSKYKNIVLDFDGVILDANRQRKLNMKLVVHIPAVISLKLK